MNRQSLGLIINDYVTPINAVPVHVLQPNDQTATGKLGWEIVLWTNNWGGNVCVPVLPYIQVSKPN